MEVPLRLIIELQYRMIVLVETYTIFDSLVHDQSIKSNHQRLCDVHLLWSFDNVDTPIPRAFDT